MADSITTTANLTASLASVGQFENQVSAGSETPAVSLAHPDEQSVPTTAAGTAVPYGPVATPGRAWFQCVDPTNYVEVGLQVSGVFQTLMKLNPGAPAQTIYIADSVQLYYRAHTAAALLRFLILSR